VVDFYLFLSLHWSSGNNNYSWEIGAGATREESETHFIQIVFPLDVLTQHLRYGGTRTF
jgi:hypothetical protein